MQDYNSMDYWGLKAECKKQKIDSKGTRDVLLERLVVTIDKPIKKPKEVKAPLPDKKPVQIIQATEDELNKYLPEATIRPQIDVSRYKPWLTDDRLQTLKNQLDPIFAAKGTFNFQLDYDKGAFGVEFNGGAAGPEFCTVIIEDGFIVRKANEYCSRRLAKGGDRQVTAMK